MLLNDAQIQHLANTQDMITPFCRESVREIGGSKVISYGISSFGYDARLAQEFKIFTNSNSTVVDPKNFTEDNLVEREGQHCIIPPNSFMLGRTIEYFKIPRDVLAICLGKSTYARCGLVVNVTPLEPGWEGQVTIEVSNTTPLPAKVYADEGICQFLFYQGAQPNVCYSTKGGKYQKQTGVTLPRV